ncbi:hypothetical protein PENTCL1PPCAC_28043, partial [Pristionchus entomophagus]
LTFFTDIMALVFGGATVEKTTTISSSHNESSTHIERTLTVTKSFTHDADGDHVTVQVHKEVGAEDHGEEIFKHSSATFEAHVETLANGEKHLQLDSISLHKDVELPNGEEIGVEVHLRDVPAPELGDRSPSRLSTLTDATSILADTYHVHTEEQEVNIHLGDEDHHDRDHIPFRTAQQDALVAQFKELHTGPPPLPTSAPPSEHVSRRGTYIEETSIIDDPIEIDREHELERIRIEAERVAELKRTLSKASEHAHHQHIHHRPAEDYDSDEDSVVPLSATHYEFDDRASIARTESFISQHSDKRDSIDLYHHEHDHQANVHEKVIEAAVVAEYVERKAEEHAMDHTEEPAIGSGASVGAIHVSLSPVTSPLTESVFMSPVSPVPDEHHESVSQTSSLNPRFSGPHIRDSIKAVEVLEHEEHHHHHHHHNHHEHVTRHDSITSAGAVARALEEMDHALQGHHNSSSVPPSPAPSRDDGSYSLNGSVRHKHHLYERMDSYNSRSSTPSGPPPPVPLWDLIKEEEVARNENVRDAPAPLHRAAPLSHLEEISSKNSVTTGSHHEDHHDSVVEAAVIAHHIHQHDAPHSAHGSVRSTSSRYGSKHSLAAVGNGSVIGAGVVPAARKYSAASANGSQCKSRGTTVTHIEEEARSRGSTLTEANVNGVLAHEHHHHHHDHTLGEVVAAHLIHEHIERRVEEEIAKEVIRHQIELNSAIEYEHQKPVSSLLSKFGGGEKKVYTKEEADARRREKEAEEHARQALEHAKHEAERRAVEEAAAAAAATHAAENARVAAIRAAEEEAARHAAQVAAAAAIHHHEQQQAAAHGHSRSGSVTSQVSHRSNASHYAPSVKSNGVPVAAHRDSYSSVRSVGTTRSVLGYRGAASRDPFATISYRPAPQHHTIAGYTRNPMTSPSLVKKSPLHAAVDANKFSSVRVVRNVRGFIKEWGQKDFVPPARSPLSPTLAIWHEEDHNSRRSSIVSDGGQSLIGRPAHIEAAPRHFDAPPTPTDARPAVTPLVERRREYEHSASITGLVEDKHGLPPMVDLLA